MIPWASDFSPVGWACRDSQALSQHCYRRQWEASWLLPLQSPGLGRWSWRGGSQDSQRMKLWFQRRVVVMGFMERTNMKNIIFFSHWGALDWISQQGRSHSAPPRIPAASGTRGSHLAPLQANISYIFHLPPPFFGLGLFWMINYFIALLPDYFATLVNNILTILKCMRNRTENLIGPGCGKVQILGPSLGMWTCLGAWKTSLASAGKPDMPILCHNNSPPGQVPTHRHQEVGTRKLLTVAWLWGSHVFPGKRVDKFAHIHTVKTVWHWEQINWRYILGH